MRHLTLSLIFLFNLSAGAGEITKEVKLVVTQCLQKGFPTDSGWDWQKPECNSQNIQMEFTSTGEYPLPGLLQQTNIAYGEWTGSQLDQRFQERIRLDEWMTASDLPQGKRRCRAEVHLDEPGTHEEASQTLTWTGAWNMPCASAHDFMGEIETVGPATGYNNFLVRPVLRIRPDTAK